MRQFGIAVYLRNLSVRTNDIRKACSDTQTDGKLAMICAELTDKAEAIERIFKVQTLNEPTP